ncbi:AcfA family outer membrane beta-barrel protein [Vibrio scophthalmi]|uniref:Outer membrane protein beta-barrel domain-containing protein n=1 Tax=Vibrio scophthalmi TaxID=45658 RepID=A0A1E3WHY1_9VIBR|nr:AcfA family outer membrane beta-barrel protein [Vibrio scophthalmi]ODS05380.1 hypothetical protein VSF3289_04521 [Vibrio scophthalmi]
MKKYCLLPLLTCALPSLASPYLGLEIGRATPHHDITVSDLATQQKLSPDSTDGFAALLAGYNFDNNFALEMGYQKNHHYHESDSRNQWDVSLTAKQFSLMPVYALSLTNSRDWSLKMKAGVTYTQYDLSASKAGSAPQHASKQSNELGMIGVVGVEYHLTDNVSMSANFKYQTDSFSSMSMMTLGGQYYF